MRTLIVVVLLLVTGCQQEPSAVGLEERLDSLEAQLKYLNAALRGVQLTSAEEDEPSTDKCIIEVDPDGLAEFWAEFSLVPAVGSQELTLAKSLGFGSVGIELNNSSVKALTFTPNKMEVTGLDGSAGTVPTVTLAGVPTPVWSQHIPTGFPVRDKLEVSVRKEGAAANTLLLMFIYLQGEGVMIRFRKP